jgi:hypothetical protein
MSMLARPVASQSMLSEMASSTLTGQVPLTGLVMPAIQMKKPLEKTNL